MWPIQYRYNRLSSNKWRRSQLRVKLIHRWPIWWQMSHSMEWCEYSTREMFYWTGWWQSWMKKRGKHWNMDNFVNTQSIKNMEWILIRWTWASVSRRWNREEITSQPTYLKNRNVQHHQLRWYSNRSTRWDYLHQSRVWIPRTKGWPKSNENHD